jgi:hypothetical protein
MNLLFYLGCPEPAWLGRTTVPLFVSDTRLRTRKSFHRATCHWALDSGGFSQIKKHGKWTITPKDYARRVRLYADEIGGMDWAAPQDWMCEPEQLVRSGLTVAEHQARTVGNFLELRALDPGLPIIPVIQGWKLRDYIACIERYEAAGIDLAAEPIVGLGSVCRRQSTGEIAALVTEIAAMGLTLHGFGVKTDGLHSYGYYLASADSQAWSDGARRRKFQLPGCTTHQNCNYCLKWALIWRGELLDRLGRSSFQPSLFEGVA